MDSAVDISVRVFRFRSSSRVVVQCAMAMGLCQKDDLYIIFSLYCKNNVKCLSPEAIILYCLLCSLPVVLSGKRSDEAVEYGTSPSTSHLTRLSASAAAVASRAG